MPKNVLKVCVILLFLCFVKHGLSQDSIYIGQRNVLNIGIVRYPTCIPNYKEWGDSVYEQEYGRQMDSLAQFLKSHPDYLFEIQAFTDSRGNDSFNLVRSQLYADVLFDHLKSRGIDSLQIKAVGKGESKPHVAWLLGNEYLFKQPSDTNALQVTLDENYIRQICKKNKRLCELLYRSNNRLELVVVFRKKSINKSLFYRVN